MFTTPISRANIKSEWKGITPTGRAKRVPPVGIHNKEQVLPPLINIFKGSGGGIQN